MKLALVSDLHGGLPVKLEAVLEGCDRIICAGDIEDDSVLWRMQTFAPVVAVRGNCDWSTSLTNYTVTIELEGVRFFVVHRPQDIGAPAPDIDVVVHGHTHIPRDETIGGVRYINPGSAVYPRGNSTRSCAVLTLANGAIEQLEFIEL